MFQKGNNKKFSTKLHIHLSMSFFDLVQSTNSPAKCVGEFTFAAVKDSVKCLQTTNEMHDEDKPNTPTDFFSLVKQTPFENPLFTRRSISTTSSSQRLSICVNNESSFGIISSSLELRTKSS